MSHDPFGRWEHRIIVGGIRIITIVTFLTFMGWALWRFVNVVTP